MLALAGQLRRLGHSLITPATLISRSQRRKRQLWTVCILFSLWGSFILSCEAHHEAARTTAVRGVGLGQQQTSPHRTSCAEAAVSVRSFLQKFCSRQKQPCQCFLIKGMLKSRQHCLWATLTWQQQLVLSIAGLIHGMACLLRLAITTAVIMHSLLSTGQHVWCSLPALSIARLLLMPGELFFTPMADAVWVSYVAQMLLGPKLGPILHTVQLVVAVVVMTQLTPSLSWSIMLLVAMWTIRKFVLAKAALNKLDAEDREAVQKISVSMTGTPWVLPVHCMVPSAGLIAMLLIIAGIEVNPGPVFQAILTLLVLMATIGHKRPWHNIAEGGIPPLPCW